MLLSYTNKFFLTLVMAAFSASLSVAEPLEGLWKGAIATPGTELAIEVKLSRGSGAGWTGSISIPVQGIKDYALADVSVKNDRVGFAMEGIPGRPTFSGTVDEEGKKIAGDFQQGPQTLGFALEHAGEASARQDEAPLPAKGIPGEGVVGEWLGTLELGPMQLRLALHVERLDSGELAASLDSLDQGAMDIGVDRISFEEDLLRFAIDQIGGSYEGRLSSDGSALVGRWTQMGNSNALTFYRQSEAVSLKRPQEPEGPFPYLEREVEFRNEDAGITLSGTLLVPEGDGPFPAVVFVSGSGPQDRDEALMGHRPFWVLGDYLARRGIASLRYDDRGFGKSEGDHMGSSVQEFADDAQSALAFLAEQEEVDAEALGILGHSEGGLTGPMVAQESDELDFLALLAPPAEAMDKLLNRQLRDISRLRGLDADLIERAAADQRSDLELIKDSELDRAALKSALRKNWRTHKEKYREEELALLQAGDEQVDRSIELVSTKWFRSLMQIDPADYLRELDVPVLALFGEKDAQVAAEVNAQILREALAEAGNEEARVEIREGLNHLFQRSSTGSISEYGQIEQTFDPATMELIADWIKERF